MTMPIVSPPSGSAHAAAGGARASRVPLLRRRKRKRKLINRAATSVASKVCAVTVARRQSGLRRAVRRLVLP